MTYFLCPISTTVSAVFHNLTLAKSKSQLWAMFTEPWHLTHLIMGHEVCYNTSVADYSSLTLHIIYYTVSQKNVLTLKRYSSKLQGAILMKFGRNVQNTLE